MTGVFYHSVIHGLGFFICFKIKILHAQNNKTRFFYVSYSDKTWVFDQSERAQGPIYILIIDKYFFNLRLVTLLLPFLYNLLVLKGHGSIAHLASPHGELTYTAKS